VSLPGWEFAASAYATTLQPDYDADWADTASVTAAVRAPSPSSEANADAPARPSTPTPPAVPYPASWSFASGGTETAARTGPEPAPEATAAAKPERAPLWTPADAPPVVPHGVDAQMPWRTLFALLVCALLAGAAYLAYPRAHDWWIGRSVPGELRAYIAGGGVVHAPAGEGYSVRLPEAPAHNDVPRSSPGTPWAAIHRSVVSGDDYRIVVRVAELGPGGGLPFGGAAALADPRIAGDVAAINVRAVTFAGQPAFDFEGAGGRTVRGRIFLRGARLYVVTVESDGADKVFDELMRSFTPAAA
jgi:hypothetical protein